MEMKKSFRRRKISVNKPLGGEVGNAGRMANNESEEQGDREGKRDYSVKWQGEVYEYKDTELKDGSND